jgi:hypothetical protein
MITALPALLDDLDFTDLLKVVEYGFGFFASLF